MTDTDDPRELRRRLGAVVRTRGMSAVAVSIPARRETVWRFLAGRTARPSQAVREGMERVLDDESDASGRTRTGRRPQ